MANYQLNNYRAWGTPTDPCTSPGLSNNATEVVNSYYFEFLGSNLSGYMPFGYDPISQNQIAMSHGNFVAPYGWNDSAGYTPAIMCNSVLSNTLQTQVAVPGFMDWGLIDPNTPLRSPYAFYLFGFKLSNSNPVVPGNTFTWKPLDGLENCAKVQVYGRVTDASGLFDSGEIKLTPTHLPLGTNLSGGPQNAGFAMTPYAELVKFIYSIIEKVPPTPVPLPNGIVLSLPVFNVQIYSTNGNQSNGMPDIVVPDVSINPNWPSAFNVLSASPGLTQKIVVVPPIVRQQIISNLPGGFQEYMSLISGTPLGNYCNCATQLAPTELGVGPPLCGEICACLDPIGWNLVRLGAVSCKQPLSPSCKPCVSPGPPPAGGQPCQISDSLLKTITGLTAGLGH